MAQYRIPDPEDLMQCPYDKTHMKPAKGFQYHLMKCRKNYTGKSFVTCPFNATHEMPKPELRHHITNCPDKAIVESELSYNSRKMDGDEVILKGYTDVPIYNDINIDATEDWDSEASVTVRLGPMYDQTYYSRVKFHDPTALNKQQWKVLTDNHLIAEQKMEELKYFRTQRVNNGDRQVTSDSLRLPKTSSKVAMPTIQPMQQPQSSVFAYSECRSGRGRAMLTNGTGAPFSLVQSVGMGRGLVPAGGIGRGIKPPPPGFCVPNINQQA